MHNRWIKPTTSIYSVACHPAASYIAESNCCTETFSSNTNTMCWSGRTKTPPHFPSPNPNSSSHSFAWSLNTISKSTPKMATRSGTTALPCLLFNSSSHFKIFSDRNVLGLMIKVNESKRQRSNVEYCRTSFSADENSYTCCKSTGGIVSHISGVIGRIQRCGSLAPLIYLGR